MKQESNKSLILDTVANLIPVSLAFLVPIFFLATTTEFYAFNKLALITLATVLLVVLWAIKFMTGQKLEFIKSVVDLPLMAFTLVVVLSTVFSLNKTLSIYGSQGRWTGLFALLILVAYFYLATPFLKDIKTIKTAIYAFAISSFISTFVSLLSYFNIFLGSAEYIKINNFSLSGSISDTAIIAALGVVTVLGLLIHEKILPVKIAMIGVITLNVFFISLTNVLAAWAVLITGIVGLLSYTGQKMIGKQNVFLLAAAGISIALIVLTLAIPATRSILVNKNFPSEISLPLRESWVVASSTIQDYPMLATGPSTFQINFTRYRPLSLNSTQFWDVRFDKPLNEFFNVLGTLGIVGLLAGLFLASKLLRLIGFAKVVEDDNGVVTTLSASVLALMVSMLFTFTSITTAFLTFSMIGMLIAAYAIVAGHIKVSEKISIGTSNLSTVSTLGEQSAVSKEYFRYIVGVPAILLAAYVSYSFFRTYESEYYMRQALVAARNNDGAKTYEFQRRAINANPRNEVYQNAYAQTNLALANALATKPDLTDQDRQTIQGLIAQSIRTTRVATEVLNPMNAASWETRAIIYRSLVNVADNAADWAIQAYNSAIQLDPSNARLRLDLGGLYYAKADYLSAANQFRQATALKQDYANAYYNFAQALVRLNDPVSAKSALEITKTLVPAGSDDYKKVEAELLGIQAQMNVAGAQDTKPSVEQIVGAQPAQPTTQQPLGPAGQAPEINNNIDLGALPAQPQPTTPVTNPTPTPTEPAN